MSLGAVPLGGGRCRFKVWAPDAREVSLVLGDGRTLPMERVPGGYRVVEASEVRPGDPYRYRLDGRELPDPASRSQPEGVHGPSRVVDPSAYPWGDAGWTGPSLEEAVIYELHVGTFSPSGDFAGAAALLPRVRDLGATVVELMPPSDFPGARGWGYDGTCLFAPARVYGKPDDLRRLVDTAHGLGLAVIVDAVYNHLGPDGNYLGAYAASYFDRRRRTPWGAAVNLDGPGSGQVRRFLIENAAHWVREYHADGLRLDATHALFDEGPRHFLAELSEAVRAAAAPRRCLIIAEHERPPAALLRPAAEGGWGLDAVWTDSFHHQLRRFLAGDSEGYFAPYAGTTEGVARAAAAAAPPHRHVLCLQNHDQVGNRALGERLHHQIDLAAYRAASLLLLVLPHTPLLFMGQEWAASSPFQYFTDHHPELGRLVTEGRRKEFARFSAFSDPARRASIPDPQDPATFERSRLDWAEREREPHAEVLRLYTALLELRRRFPRGPSTVSAADDSSLVVRRPPYAAAVRLEGAGTVPLGASGWEPLLHTEERRFCASPLAPELRGDAVSFRRPGGMILRALRR